MSALLLQLVQTSAHDVRVEAEALRDARTQALAMRRQESVNDVKPSFLDEKDMEVRAKLLLSYSKVLTSLLGASSVHFGTRLCDQGCTDYHCISYTTVRLAAVSGFG